MGPRGLEPRTPRTIERGEKREEKGERTSILNDRSFPFSNLEPKNIIPMLKRVHETHKLRYNNWLKQNNISIDYQQGINRGLNKIFDEDLNSISDLVRFIYSLDSSKYEILGFRKWISYCEEFDLIPDVIISKVKKKIKTKKRSGIDSYIPSKDEMNSFRKSLFKLGIIEEIIVKILLESGCRLIELEELLCNFDKSRVEVKGEIVVYSFFHIRGTKQAYYLFFKLSTYKLFLENLDKLKVYNLSKLKNFIKRNKLIPLKYIRKYNFTQLIQSGMSFEIANFIQGRVSQNIGFNHYLAKKEVAVKEYRKILD